MGVLDGIERLINEHGSSVILKERIALINDKYAALEQKLFASELRTKNLESDNKTLNKNLQEAKVEIENLQKLFEKTHSNRLLEVQENILALLASQETYENNIAQSLGISAQVAKLHLQDLSEMEFIYKSLSMSGQQFPWQLSQEGRRYLAKHGLLA
jgi:hypothetical protein